MTCADDTGRSRSRSTAATRVSHRSTVCAGVANRWWYQPGEVIPAPYPEAAASRECVHGTHASAALRFGSPRSSAASADAGGSGPASAGACHAPHTTATTPSVSRSAARSTCRMCASRRRSCSGRRGRGRPQFRHRLGERRERRRPVGPRLDEVLPPALRVVVPGRARQRPDRVRREVSTRNRARGRFRTSARRRVPARCPVPLARGSRLLRFLGRLAPVVRRGAGLACPASSARAARTAPAGRSQNRTGTPSRAAHSSACHSGEKTAYGQNADTRGSSGA